MYNPMDNEGYHACQLMDDINSARRSLAPECKTHDDGPHEDAEIRCRSDGSDRVAHEVGGYLEEYVTNVVRGSALTCRGFRQLQHKREHPRSQDSYDCCYQRAGKIEDDDSAELLAQSLT